MIELYSGTPGSGKSLNLARTMLFSLRTQKRNVITNTPINMEMVNKNGKIRTGEYIYKKNDELTVDFLIDYARSKHKAGREGQTLIVIDECAIMFNSREYGQFDRKAWINFFMTHRHFGYDVILVSQHDRLIDRQIRAFIEYNVVHRKANNFRTIGMIITILRIKLFVAVRMWYAIRLKCDATMFIYRKKYSNLYDTMMLFGEHGHGNRITAENEEEQGTSADGGDDPEEAPAGGMSAAKGGPGRGCGGAAEQVSVRDMVMRRLENVIHGKKPEDPIGRVDKSNVIQKRIGKNYRLAAAPHIYEKHAKQKITMYKGGKRKLYLKMGDEMAEIIKESGIGEFDLITSVPMTENKRSQRGYDQSKLLAMRISEITGIEYRETMQKNETEQQKTLTLKERQKNVKGAYKAIKEIDLKGKTVVLVDDVIKTGSTVEECSREMLKDGAYKVYCIAYAIGKMS